MQSAKQDFLVTKTYNSTLRGTKKARRQRSALNLSVLFNFLPRDNGVLIRGQWKTWWWTIQEIRIKYYISNIIAGVIGISKTIS